MLESSVSIHSRNAYERQLDEIVDDSSDDSRKQTRKRRLPNVFRVKGESQQYDHRRISLNNGHRKHDSNRGDRGDRKSGLRDKWSMRSNDAIFFDRERPLQFRSGNETSRLSDIEHTRNRQSDSIANPYHNMSLECTT
jgi:hypothetical protein